MNSEEEWGLRERLVTAESLLEALQNEEVDAFIGKESILLLRARELEVEYAELLRHLPDIVFRLDRELCHLYISPAVTAYTEKDPSAYIGKTLAESGFAGDVAQNLERACQRLLEKGEPQSVHFKLRHPSGYRHMKARLFPEKDAEEGQVRYILGITSDVTDQRKAEISLRRNEERLRQASEAAVRANQSKSDFLAKMSHEIRTPLTAILGFASILRDNPDSALLQEAVDSISENGKLLASIVDDVLDLSKVEAGKMKISWKTVSPRQVVQEAVNLMAGMAMEKKLSLQFDCDENVPAQFRSDPQRLKQILANLVSNAIKFTTEGGVEIHVTCEPEVNLLRIAVTDTGIGIPPEFRERLFRPFEQGHGDAFEGRKGTGLGLSICQRLTDALGGFLLLEQTGSKGSIFSVNLHLDLEAEPEQRRRKNMADFEGDTREADLGGRDVLIVENHRDVRTILAYYVRRFGGEPILAVSGEEALDLIANSASPPRLILLDMGLSGIDGFEVARRLRARAYAHPIIAVTAHVLDNKKADCMEAGCTDFLRKPVDAKSFNRVLFRTIEQQTSG